MLIKKKKALLLWHYKIVCGPANKAYEKKNEKKWQ